MLLTLLEWLDTHAAAYWALAGAITCLLLGWCVRAAWSGPEVSATPARRTEWIFAGLLLVFLLAWRWPFLLCASEYNPDESQFIAGAMTLRHDPVFWRSVDGTTSGPLNFYALLPLSLLGLPFGYFAARLAGVLLFWATLLACQGFFRSLAGASMARLAVLPAAVFFAAASEGDFVHFSSESVPMFLIALAAWGVVRHPPTGAIAAGLLPWAKLQALPIAGVFFAWLFWASLRPSAPSPAGAGRRVLRLVAAAVAPTILFLLMVVLTGQWEHFSRPYILQNVMYVETGHATGTVVSGLVKYAQVTGHFTAWLAGMALVFATGGMVYGKFRLRPRAMLWPALALVGSALVSILTPGRISLHYLLFLVVPLALCAGIVLGDLWRHRAARRLVVAACLLGIALPLGWRLTQPPPAIFGQLALHWRQPTTALGHVLHHFQERGARLAVWGWLNYAYVEAGMPQGTRDTLSLWSILPSRQIGYYRKRYLADMQDHQPGVFVDTVGPGSPYLFDRATQGHQAFPALASYVRDHYRLLIELQFARVYVRPDLLARHPLSTLDLQRLVAGGRPGDQTPTEPDVITPASAPRDRVLGRHVQMIEPPAELCWHLQGTEREVTVEFGLHPKAYTVGRTNGVDFIAELRMPGQPPLQVVFRPLNPVERPGDRGLLSARAVLPPFPPGTDLVVRATNGADGDGAWDWAYLAQLSFTHSPYYLSAQFPGFNRTPDRVEAPYPYLLGGDQGTQLMLPPPASLTYVLDGSESHLDFGFGLAEGAYTNGGQSDGAIYRVELHQGADRLQLFEAHLQPLGVASDRGRQQAELKLPPGIRPGDTLVLRIEPGANDSWDWTYISNLELR